MQRRSRGAARTPWEARRHISLSASSMQFCKKVGSKLNQADMGFKQRVVAMGALASFTSNQELQKVEAWIHSFRVTDMFQKAQQAPMARVAFCLEGTILLPKGMEWYQEAEKAAFPFGKQLVDVVVVEGLAGAPEAAEGQGRVVKVQDLLTSVLACTGYTRLVGKAPRGKLAYKVNRALRGERVADEEDEEI